MAKTLSTREAAERLDVDQVKLRRILREYEPGMAPGKGGRYRIPAGKVRQLARALHYHTR